MIDDKPRESVLADTNPASAMGMIDGKIRTLTPEQYQKALLDRNADEEVEDDADDDLSDLADLGAL